MKRLLIRWAISTGAVMLLPVVFRDTIRVEDWGAAIFAALIIGIVNALIGPVLKLLSLPLTILTFGLFALVVNAVLLLLAAEVAPGFEIDTFWSGLFAAILYSIVTSIGSSLLLND